MGKNRSAAVLAALVLAMSFGQARGLEIVSAEPVAKGDIKTADFLFSGSVTVKGITFEKNAVVMPATEYRDRTYNDIKILSKALYKKIEACFFKEKCSAAGRTAAPKIAVLGSTRLNSASRIANVHLSFDGDLSVTFGAMKNSDGEIWAAYPANFGVDDAALRKKISAKVSEAAKALSGSAVTNK